MSIITIKEHDMIPSIEKLIEVGKIDDVIDYYDNTPLILASDKGYTNIVEKLIKAYAKLDNVNCEGNTALSMAITNKHVDIAVKLIEAGANLDIKNRGFEESALLLASKNGYTYIALKLIKAKADLNIADYYNNTPLILAIEGKHLYIALKLIKEGANLDIVNSGGYTALSMAITNKLVDIAVKLIEAGANLDNKDYTAMARIRSLNDIVKKIEEQRAINKELYDKDIRPEDIIHNIDIKPEDRIHNTDDPNLVFKDVSRLNSSGLHNKPKGLWYSFGEQWHNYSKKEGFPLRKYTYKLNIADCNILIIDTPEKFINFEKNYGFDMEGVQFINWSKVSNEYDGIEIYDPNEEYGQFEGDRIIINNKTGVKEYWNPLNRGGWYVDWSIGSGCIWRKCKVTAEKIHFNPKTKHDDEELDGLKRKSKRRRSRAKSVKQSKRRRSRIKSVKQSKKRKSVKQSKRRKTCRRRKSVKRSKSIKKIRSKRKYLDGTIKKDFIDKEYGTRNKYNSYLEESDFPNKYTQFLKLDYYGGIVVYGLIKSNYQDIDPTVMYIFVPSDISLSDANEVEFKYMTDSVIFDDIPTFLKKLKPYVSIKFKEGKYYGYSFERTMTREKLLEEMRNYFNNFKEHIGKNTQLNMELERLKKNKKDIESLEYKDMTEKLELDRINKKIKEIEREIVNDPNM